MERSANIIRDLTTLAQDLNESEQMAFNLWTWLPSRKLLQKEMEERGENPHYVDEHQPSMSEIMREAIEVISYLTGKIDLTDEKKAIINDLRSK